ncbi:uncharacterized protein Z519_12366 [Cladophialophora bantiana CBS 173.52]|uniref:Glucose-inducible SAM-dependent methyltransferase Rrg1 n=1 Tax=Cladophialophora bantiana (strain ATCC 10958 / CBS 173.52 / CDC B-1940 / NIH 8579) TaxID=1442370 RepID=A0A0D2HRR8_CLAB1|nr:uncharacterized protein Z519_12366 [Cladophialophora bantiana CBS 173.52]KIW87069.1 hypothetical protein Z519_12366 [Cladophialophora bantiana CBS 173.52]
MAGGSGAPEMPVSKNELAAQVPQVPEVLHGRSKYGSLVMILLKSLMIRFPTWDDAVHDLPQLYQRPSASALLHVLDLLSAGAPSFSLSGNASRPKVAEQGVPRYLTSIVSSGLGWIEDEGLRDSIWSAASARLSERSGRNAMPSMTRSFEIIDGLTVNLHEPTLTQDNLGLKTWTSSVLLSRRLQQCRKYIPKEVPQVLELGAGTGLVGISAACIWKTHVVLTDLPEILPNLRRNLEQNRDLITVSGGSTESRALDWADEMDTPQRNEDKFMVIVVADPIYSAEHPKMLVNTVSRWIRGLPEARLVVELPLRDRYDEERKNLRDLLQQQRFELIVEGTDLGFDDWYQRDGSPLEVICWWSIWRPYSQV